VSAGGRTQTPIYESLEVDQQGVLTAPDLITIVDDVITRGSTLPAKFRRLSEASPQAESRCLAAVRTMSGLEVDRIMSPAEGMISFGGTHLLRQP
jgi:hypothetical protein